MGSGTLALVFRLLSSYSSSYSSSSSSYSRSSSLELTGNAGVGSATAALGVASGVAAVGNAVREQQLQTKCTL